MFCIALLLVSATIIAGLRAHFTALQSNDKSTSQICQLHQYPARSNHHNDAGERGSSLSKHTSAPLSTTSPFTSHAVDATCLRSSPTHKRCQEVHARGMRRQPHFPPHQQSQPQPRFKHADPSTHIFFESLFTLCLISGTNLEANVVAHEMTRPLQDPQPLL